MIFGSQPPDAPSGLAALRVQAMFVGHFGLAFAAKKLAPRTNLAVGILASEFIDVVWPVFVLLGLEKVRIVPGLMAVSPFDFVSYPWTHSLVMSVAWGAVFAIVYYAATRDRNAALIMGLLVVSHWFLDFLTHRADLQLAPGMAGKYGLGLWNSRLGTYVIELAIYLGGSAIYLAKTRARDAKGRWGCTAFVLFLLVLYVLNLQGPPPPAVKPALISMLVMMPLVLWWAWWFDKHRDPVV